MIDMADYMASESKMDLPDSNSDPSRPRFQFQPLPQVPLKYGMPEENAFPAGSRYWHNSRQQAPAEAMTNSSTRFEKFIKVFIVIAVLFLAGELIWIMGITPFMPFTRVDINGYSGIERDVIFAQAGITEVSSYFTTNTRSMEKALMGLWSLESVRVFKYFPNRLQIVLEGRHPVAIALAGINGRTVPVLFDSEGVIFRVGGDLKEDLFPRTYPVISGLVIENPVPGMKLPVVFVSFFRELEKIQMAAPELLSAVSEIRINRKPFDGFDLVLYPAHKRIKIRLSELNENLLRYTLLMVDVLASSEPGIDSLDFRGGIASYIPKEASSE